MAGERGLDDQLRRARMFKGVVIVVVSLLVLRLVKLQLFDASTYSGESRQNAVREVRVTPARGTITDRNGRLIVGNESAYTVLLTPRYFDESRIGLLASILSVPDSVVVQKLETAGEWSLFQPSPAWRSVSFDVIARLLEVRDRLPGVSYEWSQKRRYVAPFRASHVLGYVREITKQELEVSRADNYRSGDLYGKTGAERSYEQALRGRMGSAFRLVNVHEQEVEPFRGGAEDIQPQGGSDVVLTLDYDLQELAESLFVGKRGAVVALDPNTGGILALVSKPDYDLDIMSRPISDETWAWLQESPEKPQFNRATQSLLPPGSTWKPLVALMALQEGAITPSATITCNGGHPIGRGQFFRCMHVHGAISVRTAIQLSCNTFFFEMMNRMDINTFSRYAHALGFGERATFDLREQDSGLIPDSSYFNRVYPGGWGIGWTMNLGVGQGDMGVTPLQLARYMGAVGHGTLLYPPHVVEMLRSPEGVAVRPDLPDPVPLPFHRDYVDLVRDGMRLAMEEGTGRWLQIPGIKSAGKTGTAQNNRGKDDSVFIMFAPYDEPTIALAVLVENAGFGAAAAGPIASLMAERYLTGTIDPSRAWVMNQALTVTSDPLPEK